MAAYNLTNANVIKGSHLMVLVDNEPLAFATSHSLSKTLNINEVSTKDHGDAPGIIPQSKTYELTTENLYSLAGYQKLNTAFENMTIVDIYFGETTYSQTSPQASIVDVTSAENWSKSGFGEKGKGYITSLQVTAGAGDNATYSATFRISGTFEVDGATGTSGQTGTGN